MGENLRHAEPLLDQRQPTTAKRGFLLRALYHFYTIYLGITPPTPKQEKTVAGILLGAVAVFVAGFVLLIRFLLQSMAGATATR
jgi:hypothetical protein